MKLKYIFLSVVTLLSLSSCEDVLDTKTTWNIEDEDVWRVPELAMGVLHKAYSGIATRPDSYGDNFLDCATDNAITNKIGSDMHLLAMGSMTEFNNPIGNWSNCYNMIEYVNLFLEKGLTDDIQYNLVDATIDADIKNRLRGEAHFLRAWWHFELLKVYGGKSSNGNALGIPLMDSFITQEEASKGGNFIRPTYAAAVRFIANDLDEAIELLPEEYSGSDLSFGETQIGRATKYAAAILKSRVLVYGASPAMQNDDVVTINAMGNYTIVNPELYQAQWIAVAKEINQLFNEMDFGDLTSIVSSNLSAAAVVATPDIAFRKFFNNNLMEAAHFPPYYFGTARTTPSHNLVMAYCAKNGYPINDSRSGIDINGHNFDMTQLYNNLDSRFALTINCHNKAFGNSGAALDVSVGGKDSYNYNENGTRTGYYLAKYMNTNAAMLTPNLKTTAPHVNPFLRRTELFLNFTEAALEAWGTPDAANGCKYSPLEILHTLRSVSGGILTDRYLSECSVDIKMFKQIYQNERRIEFAFENQRYFDMRRWVLPLDETIQGVEFTRVSDGTFNFKIIDVEPRKYDDVKYYYAPLPFNELKKNKNLINNLGWK